MNGNAKPATKQSKLRDRASTELTDGIYVQSAKKPQHNEYTQTLGDMFAQLPPDFEAVKSCYDIVQMTRRIFRQRVAGGGIRDRFVCGARGKTFAYEKTTESASDGSSLRVAVPLSPRWAGQSQATVMETESDVADSVELGIGIKASASFEAGSASFHYNQKMNDRVQTMNQQSLTYAQSDYRKTSFALILDKTNVALDTRFTDAVQTLSRTKNYKEFLKEFGRLPVCHHLRCEGPTVQPNHKKRGGVAP